MDRKPRMHYPGAVYHVILRGNAGLPVFFEDRDRAFFSTGRLKPSTAEFTLLPDDEPHPRATLAQIAASQA